MKKEILKRIEKLHEELAAYLLKGESYLTEHAKKILEFQIRLVEIVKQMIEKEGRKKNGNGK